MTSGYWKQKAAPWVTIAVLAGGLVSASILFMLSRVEANVDNIATLSDEDIFSAIERSR